MFTARVIKILAYSITGILLISCSQKKAAEIEIRGKNTSQSSIIALTTSPDIKNNTNYYQAKKGDNLMLISKKLDVKIAELVHLNNLKPPYRVKSGQILHLPASAKKERKVYASNTNYPNPAFSNIKPYEKPVRAVRTAKVKATPLAGSKNTRLKFDWPVKGRVIDEYGPKPGGIFNSGINITAPSGTEVRAAASGRVIYVGKANKGFGNIVIIKHDEGWATAYSHQKEVMVSKGQLVVSGQTIGYIGKSGDVSKPQLHFALRKGKETVDPMRYLSG